jgi:hypothetical protein
MTDAEYYIDLHEKNKKHLESLNLDVVVRGPTRIIDRDGENLLIEFTKRSTNAITSFRYVRVKDSSTGKNIFLSVPNRMRSCREAVSWTFGLKSSEYDLLFET